MKNDNFIPHGEHLRTLLSQGKVLKHDITSVLKQRGVFCHSSEKSDTAPTLIKTLLSTHESNQFKERIVSRETSSKVHLRTFQWMSDSTLIDAASDILDVNSLINNEFLNYELSSFSDFYVQDGDDFIVLDFEIKRTDLLEGWDNNEKYFKGRIELEKGKGEQPDELLVNVSLNHTSPETKVVSNAILKQLESSFKSNRHINPNSQMEKISFNDFDNVNRIEFLRKIASSHLDNKFFYVDIVDFQFKPDDSSTFPDDVKWLEKNIDELKLKGSLQKTIFVNKKSLHKNLKVFRVIAEYTISIKDYDGSCKVSYEFPDFSKLENAELLIDFKGFNLKGASITLQNKIKSEIMKKIEKVQSSYYQKLKM